MSGIDTKLSGTQFKACVIIKSKVQLVHSTGSVFGTSVTAVWHHTCTPQLPAWLMIIHFLANIIMMFAKHNIRCLHKIMDKQCLTQVSPQIEFCISLLILWHYIFFPAYESLIGRGNWMIKHLSVMRNVTDKCLIVYYLNE